MTQEVAEAIRLSATIENSGQCTALRHAVVNCTDEQVREIFDGTPVIPDARTALADGHFAAVYADAGDVMQRMDGYETHPDNANICYRHSSTLPPPGIQEQWRNVYADVTSPGAFDDVFVSELATWLVDNQPITLAVNDDGTGGDDEEMELGLKLFEQTGQVVYTIGTVTAPALTCQARPQDGECFGEFPPRRELHRYTKYPVVVPTPTPAYNATLSTKHLCSLAADPVGGRSAIFTQLEATVDCPERRGYLRAIYDYLADACAQNPKVGHNQSNRTALYGLQTTPHNGQLNFLRCAEGTTMADVAPVLLPFLVTNAAEQCVAIVGSSGVDADLKEALEGLGVEVDSEDLDPALGDKPYNVIDIAPGGGLEYALPGQFISQYLCVGHVKSVRANDQAFLDKFSASKKWLKMRD